MKAIDRPFTKIINGNMQFVIPVFQRDYSWTEAQCGQIWSDILQIAHSDGSGGHFLGSMVYVSTGEISPAFTRWLLIDGQQRVTTLTLLLAAMRDHIQETGWKGDDDGPTVKRVDAYFLKNLQEEGDRHHKLLLRRHDEETLRAILDQDELPSGGSERIKENYEYFRERMKDVDPAEVYRGVGRLVVVDVTLDRSVDDPQLIFESLNSTGMSLSQSDLIRNFILMRLPEKEQTRLYECYWSKVEALFRGWEGTFDAFVRDYMALKTKASKQEKADAIHRAFRRLFPDPQKETEGVEGLLRDVLRYARYHAAFSVSGDAYPELAPALARLRRLVDVPATLVMRLFDCYDRAGTLTTPAFLEALSLIESYVVRRAVCGEQTRGYWQIFANMAYRIDEHSPLESLKATLARTRGTYRFPSDEDFQRELEQRDLYGLRVCRFLLEQLENHGSNELTDTSPYSIEHILPQNDKLHPDWQEMLGPEWKSVQRIWLHRLGNLTLTGYNPTYSDRPFAEKKTMEHGLNESSVRLNKFVREQAQWTQAEIEGRGHLLSIRALKIWPAVHADAVEIAKAEQAELRELAGRRDVAKVQMTADAKSLFDELRPRLLGLGGEVFELAQSKSISYHAPGFFLEVLPRKYGLVLLLPLDYGEIDDPTGLAEDATEWKFLFYAQYEGGVVLKVGDCHGIDRAMPIIRQAHAAASVPPG